MSTSSNQFRTKKGARYYRRRIYRKGQSKPIFSKNYTFRAQHEGSDAYFNLGSNKREAAETADTITAFLSIEGNTVEEALQKYSKTHRNKALKEKRRKELNITPKNQGQTTVGMMCERYSELTGHLSRLTVRNNLNALRYMAAGIMQLPKIGTHRTKEAQLEWRKKTEAFAIANFTNQAVEKLRQQALKEAGSDFKKQGAATTTMNSYLRSAKSVFGKKMLPNYSDLNLPDFVPFVEISQFSEPSHRYHSEIDVAELVQAAKEELKPNKPECWIIFLLAVGVGLRCNEIDKLMWEQVDFENARVWIKTTPYFRPKTKNSEDFVDISQEVMSELIAYKQNSEGEFVLSGPAIGARTRARTTFKSLYKWLREKGVNSKTPLHTLRKEAGSMIFQNSGSLSVVSEFLRNDPRIAREHYVGRKDRIELVVPGL